MQIWAPPRALYLRALMAELERIANHFGDIGAICNDASFSLMHAQCGILRERSLRAAEACFGHRLMMDMIVPSGVARDISPDGIEHLQKLLAEARRIFPRLIDLYDETASLQDRTVTTGIVRQDYARQFGAGGFVGRASGRGFDARRNPGYAPYGELDFEVPVLEAGDVNARVWIRIREIEQSLSLIDQLLAGLPAGETITAIPSELGTGEGLGFIEAFRGDVLVGCDSMAMLTWRVAICATPHGFSGRSWRSRSRAISSPTSRSAINHSTARIPGTICRCMRKTLFESLTTRAAHRAGASARRGCVGGACAERQSRGACPPRPLFSIREVDAGSCNGCELEIHALSNAFYDLERFGLRFVASPRHADVLMVTGPVTKNMREALLRTYNATPDPKWVVAVGACAVDGGIFAGTYAVAGGVSETIPVDLHIRGCPPTPTQLLSGLLALLQP